MSEQGGHILVVDDHSTNRLKMSMAAENLGYSTSTANSGVEALDKLRSGSFDLVLLDILMPEMDGYEVLAAMKDDEGMNDIPVIVISAVEEMSSAIRAIELGAEDYLPKIFDPVLLKARIGSCLEKKRLRDKTVQQLAITRQIFGKFVPERIAETILEGKGHIEPVNSLATIMFTDIAGFTGIVEKIEPPRVADMLNEYFSLTMEQINLHDGVISQFLGDAMMVAYNLPVKDECHADKAVQSALDIHRVSRGRKFAGIEINTRVGICTGDVFAGNIGSGDRLHYTIHGDAVNIAARLEQLNKEYASRTMLAESTVRLLKSSYEIELVGDIDIRGHSSMPAYRLN